tara:strand:+ start:204 stop:611 length:408 start_codon:yes stop_codon:yes gene_type:complete
MIKKPIYLVILGIILITYASITIAEENTIYYYSTTEIVNLDSSQNDDRVRMGGLVKNGSLKTSEGRTIFIVTDGATDITVHFEGIIPDLFQEDIGVVLEGSLINEIFISDEMLVKHDNEYKSSDGSTYNVIKENS